MILGTFLNLLAYNGSKQSRIAFFSLPALLLMVWFGFRPSKHERKITIYFAWVSGLTLVVSLLIFLLTDRIVHQVSEVFLVFALFSFLFTLLNLDGQEKKPKTKKKDKK